MARSYRSGFWGLVRIAVRAPARRVALRAELDGGAVRDGRDGRRRRSPTGRRSTSRTTKAAPLIAICMATYNPPLDLLERQLDSIRAQTHGNWVCIISDDCSTPESYRAI